MRLWPTLVVCKGPLWEKKVLPVGLPSVQPASLVGSPGHLPWPWPFVALQCPVKSPVFLSGILHQSPTELPKMESKDLQQLFKDVLGSEREQHLGCGTPGSDGSRTPLQRPFLQGDTDGSGIKTGCPDLAKLTPRMGLLLSFSDPVPLVGGLPLGNLPSSSPMDSYPGLCQSPFLDSRLVSMLNVCGQSLLSLPSHWGHAKGGDLGLRGAAVEMLVSAPLLVALLMGAGQWPGNSRQFVWGGAWLPCPP